MPRDRNVHALPKPAHIKPRHIMGNHVLQPDHTAVACAFRSAYEASKLMSSTSSVFDAKRKAQVPSFSREEIVLGDLLGRGGFNDVYEVQWLNVATNEEERRASATRYSRHSSDTTDMFNAEVEKIRDKELDEKVLRHCMRLFTAQHCTREKTGQARYAIKYLSPSTIDDASSFRTGAADLITETMFLSSLEHPNIIKIRGVCNKGIYGFATALEGGFFILLDRLQETLDSRLDTWAAREKKMSHSLLHKKVLKDAAKKQLASFTDRLCCALDIAAALQYLHSHSIVYRDLKPENIGFDCRGDVKIFDFGLATELKPNRRLDDGLYRLSGRTGSPRYMAPEVAKCQPYNLSADVYSFSILLWQLCSTNCPYDGMDLQSHSDLVVYGSHRPTIDESSLWRSFPLSSLMRRGWSSNIAGRPNMDSCYRIIRKEIIELRDGDATGLENSKRRSTYIFKMPSQKISMRNIRKTVTKAKAA